MNPPVVTVRTFGWATRACTAACRDISRPAACTALRGPLAHPTVGATTTPRVLACVPPSMCSIERPDTDRSAVRRCSLPR